MKKNSFIFNLFVKSFVFMELIIKNYRNLNSKTKNTMGAQNEKQTNEKKILDKSEAKSSIAIDNKIDQILSRSNLEKPA